MTESATSDQGTPSDVIEDDRLDQSGQPKWSWLRLTLTIGVLAGLAETAWAYAAPVLGAQGRCSLSVAPMILLRVALAAIATDTLLVACAAMPIAGFLVLLGRTNLRLSEGAARFARAWLLSALMGTYLATGWTFLFVASPRHTTTGRVVGCVAGIAIASLLVMFPIVWAAIRLRASRQTAWLPISLVAVCYCALMFYAIRHYPAHRDPIERSSGAVKNPRNVLLITLDTLRIDHLGCYGNTWIKTPALDSLARQAVVFDQAISQAPSTTPSHASIMTSRYPFDHEAENGRPIRSGLVTLADALRAGGYETVAFTSATTTRSLNSGLNQGFDHYVDSLVPWSTWFGRDEFQHLIIFYLAGIAQHSQIAGEVVTARAVDWLDDRGDAPFFCWLHYFDPHIPYGSPPPFRGMYDGALPDDLPMLAARRKYAEDVSYTDHQVGVILKRLRTLGLFDDTLIIVASDHGEAFGERHGEIAERGHGRYLYDTTQHVPLIIKPAGQFDPHRVSAQVELIDLAPTVLAELGAAPISDFAGTSLAEYLHDPPVDSPDRPARSFSVARHSDPDDPNAVMFVQQLALRQPPYKYITIPRVGSSELFDLSADAGESNNIAQTQSDVAQCLHNQIVKHWQKDRDPTLNPASGISPALLKNLRALGYLGGNDDSADADEQQDTGE